MVVFIRPGPVGTRDDEIFPWRYPPRDNGVTLGRQPSQFEYSEGEQINARGSSDRPGWPASDRAGVPSAHALSHERPLTAGEIQLAKSVFGNGIDYSKVLIHNRGYFFGYQNKDTAVTPNGEIYFNEENYVPDFSKENARLQLWFIHEMIHVWQYQLGYWVKITRVFHPFMEYKYTLDASKSFSDYNMEQQGDIIADYFRLKVLGMSQALHMKEYTSKDLYLYEKVLNKFLINPQDKSNLPSDQDENMGQHNPMYPGG
jgi:hypothetical protein